MKNLSKYINNLNFEYAISYSGLREQEFEQLMVSNKVEIKELEKESNRLMNNSKLLEQIKKLTNEIDVHNSRIIKITGTKHKSIKSVYKFEKGDEKLNQIFEILNTKFEEQDFWMCSKIFRDAIVFYSKEDEITGILQICFGCDWIVNEMEEDFEVDTKIFPKLKEELIQLGHKIENE